MTCAESGGRSPPRHRCGMIWRSLRNGKFSNPILKKFLISRLDGCENDSHADVWSAIYHLAESCNCPPSVGHLEHDLVPAGKGVAVLTPHP